MLDIQRLRIDVASRLHANGASPQQIRAVLDSGKQPFRPAFVNGKRREHTIRTLATLGR